jgi:hypothetical protein
VSHYDISNRSKYKQGEPLKESIKKRIQPKRRGE